MKINIFIFIIMDNSSPSSLTGSILQSSNNSDVFSSVGNGASVNGDSGSGFLSFFGNISIMTWIVIILVLSFLGFNIFVYLAKGTQDITNVFRPLLTAIFGTALTATGQATEIAAQGAKDVVNVSAGVLDVGLTGVQEVGQKIENIGSSARGISIQDTIPQIDITANNSLNKSLNTAQMKNQNNNQSYEAKEAVSSVNSSGKSGWCYIGEDKGFRTCAQVGVNDACMSGDIFPSQEICINPNLRS